MSRLTLVTLYLVLPCLGLFASGASEELKKGNAAYGQGDYEKALGFYEEAGVKEPESPYVYFDKGTAYLAKEELDLAKEAFASAISRTRDVKLEAKANYNLGQVSFLEAGKNAESDLEKAVELYRQSIAYFEDALERDKTLEDAAHNIEVTRVVLKDMLDRLAKQQEQNKDKTDKQKEIAEKIAKLIEKEESIMGINTTFAGEKEKKGMSQALSDGIAKLKNEQAKARTDTGSVRKDIEDLEKEMQQQAGGPLATAKEHVGNAFNYQQLAENQLVAKDLAASLSSETGARDELVKALEALVQPQNQDRNKDEQNKEQEKQEKEAQAAEAKDILDEEKENQKARVQAKGGYSPPDKDW